MVFLWYGGDFVMSRNLLLWGGVFFVVVVSLCGVCVVMVVPVWCGGVFVVWWRFRGVVVLCGVVSLVP